MVVPKLPLIVPKKALSGSSVLVPKLAPKISPALLSKGPALAKALHTGPNFPPQKPVDENSDVKPPEKLTKLVSNTNLGLKKMGSSKEHSNTLDSTNEDLNAPQAEVAPVKSFAQDATNTVPTNGGGLNSRKVSSNASFHDDLASRLNRCSILSDLSVGNYNKTPTKSLSKEHDASSNVDKWSKLASLESKGSKAERDWDFQKGQEHKLDDTNSDEREDVGYTPWLKIEKRINQIRSMASKDSNQKAGTNKGKPGPSLYNNYKTDYEEFGWKKEVSHPLSYGMVQKLNDKRQFELPKDNWKFINGFLKPRRKPFTSMSEMSKYFQKVDTKDQYELIKLLLACRDLEKVIEEQHTVLDMLDHDLREARDLFPDSLNNVTTKKLYGSTPDDEPFYPSSDVPLFIKGRVFLLPKNGKNTPNGKK